MRLLGTLKITVLACLSVLVFNSCSDEGDNLDKEPERAVRFLAIGDFGRDGVNTQLAVAAAMETVALAKPLDFVLALGDNFYPDGVSSVDDPQWKTSFEDIYIGEGLKDIPWYAILGNHDYLSNPDAEVAYSKVNSQWRMPHRYYTITITTKSQKVRLVVIDTSPFEKSYYRDPSMVKNFVGDTATQRIWMDSVFALNDATWTIVAGHHPFFTGGARANLTNSVRESLLPDFNKYNVQAYFSGHEHDLQHIKPDDIKLNQFVSGTGAETRPTGSIPGTKFSASENGFMAVEVVSTEVRVYVINSKLDTLYQTVITK